MSFTLKALGGLVVEGPAGPLGGAAAQRRTLALLVLVAMARKRGASREKLVGLLWPDTSDERARHALAQTLYRLRHEFGDEAVEAGEPLRLNTTVFRVDVAEWEGRIARGELEEAAAMYGGPFLDGFVLPGAAEFERWAEAERTRVAALHRDVLERLATAATHAGEPARAARYWRALAGCDPLDSRVASRLVGALVDAGDRAMALQYARVHSALVREELDAEPGTEFAQAVARARDVAPPPSSTLSPSPIPAPIPPPVPPPVERAQAPESGTSESAATAGIATTVRRRRNRVLLGIPVVAALLATAIVYARSSAGARDEPPLLGVGLIADYTGGDSSAAARILPEMLTANLSRVEGLAIVSRTRLYELLVPQPGREPTGSDFARAAQDAGVDELLDGALYRRADGTFRLDLRLIDVRSARVRRVYQLEAPDAFALADSATLLLATGFGFRPREALRVSDVSTSSVVAYGLYEEGLRSFWQLDWRASRRLFEAALEVDSNFAMAAFGAFQSSGSRDLLQRALRLTDRVTDFERLSIRAAWARSVNHPSQVAIAETLAARYPAEPASHIVLANALHVHGDFPGAQVAARHAYAMDTVSLTRAGPRCTACEALTAMFAAYQYMDSTEAALRIAQEWTSRQPSSPVAWWVMREAQQWRDSTAALQAYQRMRAASRMPEEDLVWLAAHAIRWGDFEKAERFLEHTLELGPPERAPNALWWLAISERQQGRLEDALATVLRMKAMHARKMPSQLEAQVLFEMGRAREAAAIFDLWVEESRRHGESSDRARNVAWNLVHKGSALAAAGDTTSLTGIADSLQAIGRKSGYGRDPLLHHHLRGLLLAARGEKEAAVDEFRRAIWSPVAGYTRTNLEMGRLLLELGRPREAIAILGPALRGGLESTNMYVTHTEIRALLARGYAATGQSDSARTHARWVERALTHADPPARARIMALLGESAHESR